MKPYKHKLPYGSGVPRHFNCRSMEVPFMKTFKELGAPTLKELPPGTQWTPDGEIPSDITLAQWLRGKPKKFVDGLLGKKRSQMFLDGKISLGDLISHNQRVLTLDELKDRVNGMRVKGVPHRTKKYGKVQWGTGLVVGETLELAGIVAGTQVMKGWWRGRGKTTPVMEVLPEGFWKRPLEGPGGKGMTFEALRNLSIGLWSGKGLKPPFKSRGDFVGWGDRSGLSGSASLWDEMGAGNAGDVAMELDRLQTAFPEIDVDRLAMGNLGSGTWAQASGSGSRVGIEINRELFGGSPSRSDAGQLIREMGEGWSTPSGAHVPGLITHEFGHGVHSLITKQLGGTHLNPFNSFLTNHLLKLRATGESSLGQYGLSNIDELFAETFTSIQWTPIERWTDWQRVFHDELVRHLGDRPFLNAGEFYGSP